MAAKRLNALWTLRAACALLASCCALALSSCGGSAASAQLDAASAGLRVLDSGGNELPASSARLVAQDIGADAAGQAGSASMGGDGSGAVLSYAIYAMDQDAAGFCLSFPEGLRVVHVERGEYFGSSDLYLAMTNIPGRVDIGGYRFERGASCADGDEDDEAAEAAEHAAEIAKNGTLVATVTLVAGSLSQRTPSTLPTGAGCIPAGFGYTDNGNGSANFHWSFHSTGDYNQDGEVYISDLTPVGASFHKRSTDSGWASASLADGDGNGEVNISDITPIGVNYATLLSGYKLERAGAQSGPFNEVASLLLSDGTASPGLAFSYLDAAALDGGWYRVRAFNSTDPASGAATDPLQISLAPAGEAPVADFNFAPASPLRGELVSFTDASTGDPTGWSWSFGEGGTSSAQSPTHTFVTAGTYTVTLTASNTHGSRQASQQVTVSDPPPVAGPEDTFVAQSWATLNAEGTAFEIHSTDKPDGTAIIFGPLTQGMPPADNNLLLTYPYRGGLDEPASPHPDIHTQGGIIGMTVAGMAIYGATNASTITISGTTWTYDANAARINGEDAYSGHCSPANGGQYHYHDVGFITNNSWVGVTDFNGVYTWADGHSKIVGWSMDGYPVYGPYGYVDPLDSGSGVTRMTPSWAANDTGANRPADVTAATASASSNSVYIVLTSDPGGLGINPGMRITEINGVPPATELYVTNQQNITYVGGGHPPYTGPANGVEVNAATSVPSGATVKFEFLPGIFIEDEAYVGGGTVDRYNGRWCVTPDFPTGTYAYFCTMDAAGKGQYPYMIGPELYGSTAVGATPGTGYVRPAQ